MAPTYAYRYFFILLITSLSLAGCRPLDLERQEVPVMWGMRYEEPAAEADINGNLAEMRRLVLRQLVLELPVVAGSNGLPKIPHFQLTTLLTLLRQYKTRLHLAFTTIRPKDLFPPKQSQIPDPDAWFASLEQQVDSVLRIFRSYPPDRVIIGNDWELVEQHPEKYGIVLNHLRKKFTGFFSYSAGLERIEEVSLWPASDEITIDYTPSALADQKTFARTHNQAAGKVAQQHRKSIFIFRANLLGNDPLLQFKNRLRFWPEDRLISGICINTIYSRIAARDETSYYGLLNSPEIFTFLDQYRRPPE